MTAAAAAALEGFLADIEDDALAASGQDTRILGFVDARLRGGHSQLGLSGGHPQLGSSGGHPQVSSTHAHPEKTGAQVRGSGMWRRASN